MNIKLKITLSLISALMLAPATIALAADEPAEEVSKPKKKLPKKPFYTKFSEAMKVAEANGEPVLVFMVLDDDGSSKNSPSKTIENDLFKSSYLVKDYAKSNLVLLKMKLKLEKVKGKGRRGRVTPGDKVDEKESLRTEEERRFVNTHCLNPRVAKAAKQKNEKVTPLSKQNYPQIICIKGSLDKQEVLFYMDPYRQDDGFGPWLSSLDGLLRAKKIEPVVSDKMQKILDDPVAFGGKKKR